MKNKFIKNDRPQKIGVNYPIFSALIDTGSVYVDKTMIIHQLLMNDKFPFYFFSRPRRFGKTLLISTLEEIFGCGINRFQKLDIVKQGLKHDWSTSHVIRIDMTSCGPDADSFDKSLAKRVCGIASNFGISLQEDHCAPAIFNLIESLNRSYDTVNLRKNGELRTASNPGIVLLIDEYDFQLISNLDSPEKLQTVQDTLFGFYASIKSASDMLRFMFVTGIARFKELSPISGMNTVSDISYHPMFSQICGFTEDEIDKYFSSHLKSMYDEWKKQGILGQHKDVVDIYNSLVKWYDGYSWDGITKVFNPISVLMCLSEKFFDNYWYNLGGPNFLKKLQLNDLDYFSLFNRNIEISGEFPIQKLNETSPNTALLHTGYLTINKIDPSNGVDSQKIYHLNIPNHEVRISYVNEYLIEKISAKISDADKVKLSELHKQFALAFCAYRVDEAEINFSKLLIQYPYKLHCALEAYYASHLYTALNSVDVKVSVEKMTSEGVIDLLVQQPNGDVMVVEVKYSRLPESSEIFPDHTTFDDQTNVISDELSSEQYHDFEFEAVSSGASDAVVVQRIRRLLEQGKTRAIEQIRRKKYTVEYLDRNINVWMVAVSIVGRTNVKILFEQIRSRN
ncbi:MAG: AAA family ATPase [Deltaproteobacteria bacterium]|jgi:hypothetical protein|nr:AAA family ATPase [Deltaproteobacteria bacterium]